MATGMKTWLGLTGLGVAVVSMWLLPPGSNQSKRNTPETLPEEVRYRQIESQLSTEMSVLARLTWLDSLVALLHQNRPAQGPSVVIDLGSDDGLLSLPPSAAAEPLKQRQRDQEIANFRQRFARDLEASGVGRSDVDIGFFTLRVPDGSPEMVGGIRTATSGEYFVGSANGRPYCIATRVVTESHNALYAWDEFGGNPGRMCGWVARYGLPGARVNEWLRAGAWSFGSRGSLIFSSDGRTVYNVLENVVAGNRAIPATEKCLRGDARVCGQLFAGVGEGLPWGEGLPEEMDSKEVSNADIAQDALSSALPERWGGRLLRVFPTIRGEHTGLFADLEKEFGAERFATFWGSEQDVPTAFRNAFGISHEAWMLQWERSKYPEYSTRYRTNFLQWGQAAVLVVGMMGLMVGVAKRRQVA